MALNKIIKDALKDLKIGEESAVSVVEAAFDKAEAKDKVQKANEELTAQRKEWEAKDKEYKASISKFEKSEKEKSERISDLEKEKLTPEERAKLKSTESIEANFNKIKEELSAIKAENETEKSQRVEAQKKAKDALISEKKQAQKVAISNELNKHKITDDKNTQAIHTLFGEGLVKLEEKEDGTTTEIYYRRNKDKELVASTLEELVSDFADKNKHYVQPSGINGLGQNHTRLSGGTVDFSKYSEARKAIDQEWDMGA